MNLFISIPLYWLAQFPNQMIIRPDIQLPRCWYFIKDIPLKQWLRFKIEIEIQLRVVSPTATNWIRWLLLFYSWEGNWLLPTTEVMSTSDHLIRNKLSCYTHYKVVSCFTIASTNCSSLMVSCRTRGCIEHFWGSLFFWCLTDSSGWLTAWCGCANDQLAAAAAVLSAAPTKRINLLLLWEQLYHGLIPCLP